MPKSKNRRKNKQGHKKPFARQQVHVNQQALSIALKHHRAGNLPKAQKLYLQILERDPNHSDALQMLGVMAYEVGKYDISVGLTRKAISIRPDFPEAHTNLANALFALGHMSDAVIHYRRAIEIVPRLAEAHTNLGNALFKLGDLNAAIGHHHKAIHIKPGLTEAHINLGVVLQDIGRLDEAITQYSIAIGINPQLVKAHSNLIFCQDYAQTIDLSLQQRERRRWEQSFGVPAAASRQPHANTNDPNRRLRIGYVSGDFYNHSAALGFAPLIMDHDRDKFEIVCYAGNTIKDKITEKFISAASLWRSTIGVNDESVAEMIRSDKIDILVDLSGHSSGNRLPVFTRKPAPIQMTGIGHLPPGLSAIDYRLTTEHITSRDEEPLFPEQPIYLRTYMGYMPASELPPVGPAPCLETGYVTFGCFNRFMKVSLEATALWSEILKMVPGSKLALKDKRFAHEKERDTVYDLFRRYGIEPERLILLPITKSKEHLATYGQIDITLDPFPHGGGISSIESLLMGVPVVGMANDFKLSTRVTRMMCAPVGLHEWMAGSPKIYKFIAIDAALNPERLTEFRSSLRQRVWEVYSMFTGDVESAYRIAWQRWCYGMPPAATHHLQFATDLASVRN